MADPLGTSVRMPSRKDLERAIVATFAYTAAGAGAVVTVTLDNDYPPIKMEIQSPVLCIVTYPDETAGRAVGDINYCTPNDQMARGTSPDSANEFQITGGRTFEIWDTSNKNGYGLICYIPKGTPQNK